MTEFFLKLMAVTTVLVIAAVYFLWGPSTVSVQRGYEGVGMDHVFNRDVLGKTAQSNEVPIALPMADPGGPKAAEAYENVQVLGNLSTGQFVRLMATITQWVSPEQGCNYCHNPNNMASDEVYTKHVARRMFQMTQHINENWQSHVKETGVTCWTCHRGQPVPKYIWFNEPRNEFAYRALGNPAQQNIAGDQVTFTSLPNDPLTPFLEQESNIRVIGNTPLPTGNRSSIKQAEWTYGLMIHMSNALGVNCTYCHNSRSFAEWAQSPPARTTAWYGIRMVRDINGEYTTPLLKYYPENRKGSMGDAPKANCKTCHQGAYKPLLGAQMAKNYPNLQKSTMYVPPPPPVDSDGDGMMDDDDKCPDEVESANGYEDKDGCPDEVPAALESVTGPISGVAFVTGDGRMARSSVRVLMRAIRVLRQYPDLKVEVGVHSDNVAEEEANLKLTQLRADVLQDFLSKRGLDADRITAIGFGSSKPIAPNDTDEGRATNRRVEFSLFTEDAQPADAEQPADPQ